MQIFSRFRRRKATSGSKLKPVILFPRTESISSVNSWTQQIQALPERLQCRIRKITHCKFVSSGHEFLLVHVHHPSKNTAILLVERIAQAPDRGSASVFLDDDYSTYDWHTRTNPILAARSTALPLRDRVKVSHDGSTSCLTSEPFDKLHKLSFRESSTALSVAHLAALLTTINRHTLDYGTDEQVSSWYAYVTLAVTKSVFYAVEKVNQKYAQGKVSVAYRGINIAGRDSTEVIVREYRRVWDDVSGMSIQLDKERLAAKDKHPEKRKREQDNKAKKSDDREAFTSMLITMDRQSW